MTITTAADIEAALDAYLSESAGPDDTLVGGNIEHTHVLGWAVARALPAYHDIAVMSWGVWIHVMGGCMDAIPFSPQLEAFSLALPSREASRSEARALWIAAKEATP